MLNSLLLSYVAFQAFPDSKDAILSKTNNKTIQIDVSGSLGIYHGDKCHKTFGNETLISDKYNEWCSNIAKDTHDKNQNPFIQYSIQQKRMAITRYSVRNGCCYYACCCSDVDGKIIDYDCCCNLYSYSLHGSNDNLTWTLLHKVEKDRSFDYCGVKTFELNERSQPFKYLRFVLDEEWPNCPKCMQINQIEFYGETVASGYESYDSSEEEESISIIGRVKKE